MTDCVWMPAGKAVRTLVRGICIAMALSAAQAQALQSLEATTHALKKLSIEELMNIEVTSVSRTEEYLSSAAAAVAVITQEDIARSGATSIPEALRLVPGLHVARRNASYWTVGARGFSSSNSEKLLVLSDTRSLYTPLFSGVAWDVQDYLLSDIERIEVIRGPGAALWGSNAVNGVINITTKSAYDTLGTRLEAALGTEEELSASISHGDTLADDIYFRVFAKHAQRDDTYRPGPRSDDWRNTLVGFRADWQAGAVDRFTLQGNAYRGEVGLYAPSITIIGRAEPSGTLRTQLRGGYVLTRWQRQLADDSNFQLRFYVDRTHRDNPSFRDDLDTYDLDFQHRLSLGGFAGIDSQLLTWGLNYRYTDNRNIGKGVFRLDPSVAHDSVFSAFVQDQMPVSRNVELTIGSKFEYNDFSGFELQPSIRASWNAAPDVWLWTAVSRAVRVPTRLERDVDIDLVDDPTSNPTARLMGNSQFDSEELIAYEIGARWRPLPPLFLDLAVFHHRYEELASLELGTPFIDPRDGRTVIPVMNRNLTHGRSRGVELLATFTPHERWHLTASYTYIDLELDPAGDDLNRGEWLEGATPRHQWALQASVDLTNSLTFDLQLRSLDAIRSSPEIVMVPGRIPGYTELDARIAWHVTPRWELSLVGQNLLHERHVEFGSPAARGAIERGVYGKLSWDF